MKKILGFLITPIFHFYFVMVLVLLHPVQVLAHKLFGEAGRQRLITLLIYLLVFGLRIMGCRIKFNGLEKIPEGRPLIVVSNHQSLYDIPALSYAFKNRLPKFISKIELGKNLPSISYNLIHGQSALIDRSNGAQSVKEIFKLGRLIESTTTVACIFPEGTRSKTGKLRPYMSAGINTLLRSSPSALVVPFVIDGHSELINNGKFPFRFGVPLTYTVLDYIDPKGIPVDDLITKLEEVTKRQLNQS